MRCGASGDAFTNKALPQELLDFDPTANDPSTLKDPSVCGPEIAAQAALVIPLDDQDG